MVTLITLIALAALAAVVVKMIPSRQPTADEKYDRMRQATEFRRRPVIVGREQNSWGRWPQKLHV